MVCVGLGRGGVARMRTHALLACVFVSSLLGVVQCTNVTFATTVCHVPPGGVLVYCASVVDYSVYIPRSPLPETVWSEYDAGSSTKSGMSSSTLP